MDGCYGYVPAFKLGMAWHGMLSRLIPLCPSDTADHFAAHPIPVLSCPVRLPGPRPLLSASWGIDGGTSPTRATILSICEVLFCICV